VAKTRKTAVVRPTVANPVQKSGKVAKAEEHVAAEDVTVDRRATGRTDRRGDDRRKQSIPVAVERRKGERRAKVNRRRQIDPTTCERDYSAEEVEFMNAMELYKRSSGRMFPTCSEVLEVIRGLGYEKRPVAPVAETPASDAVAAPAADAAAPTLSA